MYNKYEILSLYNFEIIINNRNNNEISKKLYLFMTRTKI